MSKTLKVVVSDTGLEEIRRSAQQREMSVSEWVRVTLREARKRKPSADVQAKLEAVRKAAEHEFPTADIDQMLDEIRQGFLGPAKTYSEMLHNYPPSN